MEPPKILSVCFFQFQPLNRSYFKEGLKCRFMVLYLYLSIQKTLINTSIAGSNFSNRLLPEPFIFNAYINQQHVFGY